MTVFLRNAHRGIARRFVFPLLGLLAAAGASRAETVTIAVASNFLAPLQALQTEFERASGHTLRLSSGSTGLLYAQIRNGAPFDVLLAADADRPRLLAEQGFAEPASVFTYAAGRLALWSRDPARVGPQTLAALAEIDFRWLAIAETEVAPYGRAARQALERLGVWAAVETRVVRGQNIGQTFSMVETGNAELGLVALSQALAYEGAASYALVPANLHDPISQDAALLRPGTDNAAARAFLDFLKSAESLAIIERFGYTLPGNP